MSHPEAAAQAPGTPPIHRETITSAAAISRDCIMNHTARVAPNSGATSRIAAGASRNGGG